MLPLIIFIVFLNITMQYIHEQYQIKLTQKIISSLTTHNFHRCKIYNINTLNLHYQQKYKGLNQRNAN